MALPPLDELNLLHTHICQALGDPKRLQILYALDEAPRRVTDLAQDLEMPQPTVSRHLAILRQRALVVAERDGASVTYCLADHRLIDVMDTMRQVLRESLDRQTNMLA